MHEAELVDEDLVRRVHDHTMIAETRELAEGGGGHIDADTYVSPGSYEAALAAVGGAVQATEHVLTRRGSRAFSMARPPGHHAERRRQIGFCLFNSVAIAAQHAQDRHGLERIAIIDWDVHHGNGTQNIFYESDKVLYCSVHQWPLFPGTGLESERGTGKGEGYTLNAPMSAGSGDADYRAVFDDLFAPAVFDYKPQLVMVSAGFDAHLEDPLAMMAMGARGFGQLADIVRGWADKLCDGRLVLVLEGGYNLRALADSVEEVLRTLDRSNANERDSE